MGKSPEGKEVHKEAHKEVHKPEHKPESHGKGHKTQQLPGGCLSPGCKTPVSRFGFCPEHYEQFKFGLIKKTGEPVSDYEKKFEHYAAFKTRKHAHKVA
jgi:hypothetical protein